MIQVTRIPEIGAKIKALPCGTAMQRTITVTINSELDAEEIILLINELDKARGWVMNAPKGCTACAHADDCPEREGKK